jgi:condensin complex subunit 3
MCRIVETVLRGFDVKDKTVRFRATQTVALLVNSVEQLDNELYGQITLGLLKRLRDKEPFVRVQAVLGLGRLANEDEEDEDEDSDDETAGNILVKLLDIMQNDPSAEVRRAVLMNLPFTPKTIKYLLERARDLDPITRRTLYGKLLPVLGDFRHLSLVEREKLLRWGLRDRDEMVRKATARLFSERWIEHCALSRNPIPEEERKPGEPSPPDIEALTELLERIDVARSGVEDGVAHQAMREFWELRPDYREDVHFDDDFWNQLTPEAAFVVRSFNDFCLNDEAHTYTDLLENKLPEIMRFAKFIEIHLNRLLEDSRRFATLDPESEEALELDEECDAQVFVVEQLLYIALTLDYTDEVGRRMVNTMMQDALSRAELPESCTKLAVEVLRTVCSRGAAGEKEFINLITTALGEIKDTLNAGNEAEESFHSARSDASGETMTNDNVDKRTLVAEEPVPSSKESAEERKLREWFVNQKCLHIAECMLQNVHLSKLEGDDTNQDLNSILNRLIIPAVQDKHTEIREAGLRCMGLSCLLSEVCLSSQRLYRSIVY